MRAWIFLGCVVAASTWAATSTAAPPKAATAKAAPTSAATVGVTVDADSVIRYVESCRKPNGAFGPLDQEYTDAAWNYPAVSTLQLLGVEVAEPAAILKHGLGSPAGHGGMGHLQFFHYHSLRAALGVVVEELPGVAVSHQGFKRHYYSSPYGTRANLLYEVSSKPNADPFDADNKSFVYHNLSSLYYLVEGLRASSRSVQEPQPLVDYVTRRQTSLGGFADGGESEGGDAHIAHTYQAVVALASLGASIPNAEKIVAFVESCRDKKTGGYRWNPKASLPGNEPDAYYTWAALATLRALKSTPTSPEQTQAWLNSLHNADGGFGDRPGWRSRLYSTYYAVAALGALGEVRSQIISKQVAAATIAPIAADGLRIYQAQFKMPVVEPSELAGLHKRGFNLLALKSSDFAAAERLLSTIREQKLPMDVVLCPEAYSHRLTQLGGVPLNHVGNFTLDPRWTAEQRSAWQTSDEAGGEFLTWAGYRDRVVKPIAALGSIAYPEQDYEMEYSLISYGSDRSGAKGYNAVLAGFNWPPRDFVRVFPWRERYVDRLTPIADVDAHGSLAKWSDKLDTTRTLFIAAGPTYADFQEAAAAGRVVTVVAQPEGVPSGASYYGPPAAVDFVRTRRSEWQWWQ